MDYLRTLGSAAVSTLVQKSGLNLPFTLGQKVSSFEGVWTLYDGTKRDDGSLVSILEYDFSTPQKKATAPLARNSLRKLRTTRHPDVLKFMDVVESETQIYIMTERVRPLSDVLSEWSGRGKSEREDWLIWGVHRLSVALAFINDGAVSTHGNVRTTSCFISPSGEWKLGGFELMSNPKDEAAVLYNLGSLLPNSLSHASPEVKKSGFQILKDLPPSSIDSYSLAILLHTLFNPSAPELPTTLPPHPPPTRNSLGAIPASLIPSFLKLLHPSPKTRLTTKVFLELGMSASASDGGFFINNKLVKVCLGLDGFNLSSDGEKTTLLRTLKESAGTFPPAFASLRVLPSLVNALEFGGASASSIIPILLQLGSNVSPADYPTAVLAPLIKLFASSDRGIRMALLDHLGEYADKLDKKNVGIIWPSLQTGFTDTVPVIREATVKAISLLSPKLPDKILNNDLLRHLAHTQNDPEPSIRTNTCILIGRLAPSLSFTTKKKVLVPAFARALKDPFIPARMAGLEAFQASVDEFEAEDVAAKVLPVVSSILVDRERSIREKGFKVVDVYVKKLEVISKNRPDAPPLEEGLVLPGGFAVPQVPGGGAPATLVNSAAGAAGALAGWAITSIGRQLAKSDIAGPIAPGGGDPHIGNLPSRPVVGGNPISSPEVPTRSNLGGPKKGMQLGANKVPASSLAARLADEIAAEEAEHGSGDNPWGNDDLIDVNADQDDWSAFETAATVEAAPVLHDPWSSVNGSPTITTYPKLSTTTTRKSQPTQPPVPVPTLTTTAADDEGWGSVEPKRSTTPVPPSPLPSMAGMSKEEKTAEMNRRKEERKQRIAQLKEQKKAGGK